MNLETYVCACCGGQIDLKKMECPFCGAKYRRDIDDNIIRIETFRNPVEVIKGQFTMDKRDYLKHSRDVDFMRYVASELSHKIAERIVPLCEYEVAEDIYNHTIKINTVCRVVRPEQRSNSEEILSEISRRVW